MSYTSVANPPLHDGASFKDLSDIPDPREGDCYMDQDNGDVIVRGIGGWHSVVSSGGQPSSAQMGLQVLESSIFREKLAELALFQSITKQRYFQIKHLYKSEDVNNRVMAGNIVLELHKEMING